MKWLSKNLYEWSSDREIFFLNANKDFKNLFIKKKWFKFKGTINKEIIKFKTVFRKSPV